MCSAVWLQMADTTIYRVEFHNKISHTKTTLLVANLETYYRIDKRAAYNTLAASMGIKIGDLDDIKDKKKRYREIVRRRKRQVRLVTDDGDKEIESTNKKSKDTVGSEIGSSVDQYVGKTVWIDTFRARNKKYNWCKATVESADKFGVYVAR